MDAAAGPPIHRTRLSGSAEGRLLYAQVHEDPRLEMEALTPVFHGRIVVVTSGGCTALSLLASGARDVVAVDSNQAQNHITELKAAACRRSEHNEAIAFLGGRATDAPRRIARYEEIRGALGADARRYWDSRRALIARGVLGVGVSERFMSGIAGVMRLLVHPRRRIEGLLACETLEAQRTFYHREWNSRRWRLLFRMLLTRGSLERTFDPAMYTSVKPLTVGARFHAQFERTLTELPVADNYFLHQALLGEYRSSRPSGLPPYLGQSGDNGALTLVDATLTEYLRTQPSGAIDGFAISNVCEWLDDDGIDALFTEVVRTAAAGAVLCIRNFLGWTEVPERWRERVVEDRAVGEALFSLDRSLVNRRFAVCRVNPPAA